MPTLRSISYCSAIPRAIAFRCAATPSPWRRLDSASASAWVTRLILSASARDCAATRSRWAALMEFIESRTR